MAPKQREGRPHKKQHNQKSIADLWQPLVTEKETFDQEQDLHLLLLWAVKTHILLSCWWYVGLATHAASTLE